MAVAAQQQSKKPAQAKRRGLSTTTKMVLGVSALPLLGVLLPTLIVLVPFMLPSISAFVFDRSREKFLAITVGMPNVCGTLPALGTLWATGQSFSSASLVLGDVMFWLIAYAAAAMGWFLHGALPPFMAGYYQQASRARILHLQRKQKTLVETWGEDVSQTGVPQAKAAAPTAPAAKPSA